MWNSCVTVTITPWWKKKVNLGELVLPYANSDDDDDDQKTRFSLHAKSHFAPVKRWKILKFAFFPIHWSNVWSFSNSIVLSLCVCRQTSNDILWTFEILFFPPRRRRYWDFRFDSRHWQWLKVLVEVVLCESSNFNIWISLDLAESLSISKWTHTKHSHFSLPMSCSVLQLAIAFIENWKFCKIEFALLCPAGVQYLHTSKEWGSSSSAAVERKKSWMDRGILKEKKMRNSKMPWHTKTTYQFNLGACFVKYWMGGACAQHSYTYEWSKENDRKSAWKKLTWTVCNERGNIEARCKYTNSESCEFSGLHLKTQKKQHTQAAASANSNWKVKRKCKFVFNLFSRGCADFFLQSFSLHGVVVVDVAFSSLIHSRWLVLLCAYMPQRFDSIDRQDLPTTYHEQRSASLKLVPPDEWFTTLMSDSCRRQ